MSPSKVTLRILFVRHAQSTANVLGVLDSDAPGPHLTELGRGQAAAFATAVEDMRIDRIYASSLRRTQESAAPLAQRRDLVVEVVDGLREVEAGDLEMCGDHASVGKYVETVMAWAGDALDASVPGGPDGHGFFLRFDAATKIDADPTGEKLSTARS